MALTAERGRRLPWLVLPGSQLVVGSLFVATSLRLGYRIERERLGPERAAEGWGTSECRG